MSNQYQNVSYKDLLQYSQNNPNRNRQLDSIEIHNIKPSQDTSLASIGLKGYNAFNLNPSGVLSLIVCINDPTYYSLATISTRTQLIIDITTKLQQQTDELKNTSLSRKRKKIRELISAAYNGSPFEEKDYFDIFNGISMMCHIQFILMKSSVQEGIESDKQNTGVKGEIMFSSNPTNWKYDTPIWIVDYHARWIAIPSDKIHVHKMIATWITDIESTGWIIKWPEIDGTKTEIVEYLSLLPTWKATDVKLNKDILAVRLGRANCIKVFSKWMNID